MDRVSGMFLVSGFTYIALMFILLVFFFVSSAISLIIILIIAIGTLQAGSGILLSKSDFKDTDSETTKTLKLMLILNMLIITGIATSILCVMITDMFVLGVLGVAVLAVMLTSIALVIRSLTGPRLMLPEKLPAKKKKKK